MKIKFNPDIIICANNSESYLPIFEGKGNDEVLKIYVCGGNTCQSPVNSIEELYKNNLKIK